MENRHFHRRNLPHLYYEDGIYFITYRLKDSLPYNWINKYKDEITSSKTYFDAKTKRIFKKYDEFLDSNELKKTYLSIPEIANLNVKQITDLNENEFRIICYCIMPNHIHLVFTLLKNNKGISSIMKRIKGKSARECNIFLKQSGNFWQDESFDRLVRDERELFNVINYVINNPVKAGLVNEWQDWKYTYLNKEFM